MNSYAKIILFTFRATLAKLGKFSTKFCFGFILPFLSIIKVIGMTLKINNLESIKLDTSGPVEQIFSY